MKWILCLRSEAFETNRYKFSVVSSLYVQHALVKPFSNSIWNFTKIFRKEIWVWPKKIISRDMFIARWKFLLDFLIVNSLFVSQNTLFFCFVQLKICLLPKLSYLWYYKYSIFQICVANSKTFCLKDLEASPSLIITSTKLFIRRSLIYSGGRTFSLCP